VFGRWNHTNVLFYYKYVKGELENVDVRYKLPRVEYILDVIRSEQPAAVYFTFSPVTLGFHVEEVTPVIRGLDLYRVSLVDQ
jgi:hypothetical protein